MTLLSFLIPTNLASLKPIPLNMKKLKALLVVSLLLIIGAGQAQIIDRAEDKAKNKTNQRIDNKIDKGIDKSLDKIEGIFKKKPKKDKSEKSDSGKDSSSDSTEKSGSDNSGNPGSSDQQDMSEMMKMMGGKSITVDESFTFDHNVELKTEMYNSKGKLEDTFNHTLHLSDDFDHFGMNFHHEEGEGQMVYQFDEKRILIMSEADGQTFGMVSYVDDTQVDHDTDIDSNFGKTGNKKVILGYKCEEWAGEEDGVKTNVWVAEDPELMFSRAFSEMARAQNDGKDPYGDYPNGMMMEMTSLDTNTGEKTVMICTAVNKNTKSTISTSGYEFMDLSGMQYGR